MPNKNTLQPVHKHVLGVALVAVLAVIFGLVIYPKLAILAELPTKPQNLSVDIGADYVVARWDAPALNGDSPIIGYDVTYYRSDKPGNAINDSVSDATFNYSIALADLTPEFEYTFIVKAVNSGGPGDPNTATFTPPAVVASVPSAPQNCLLTPGDAQVTISCDLPADLAGADMSSYVIYYGTKDYTPIEVATTKALAYVVTSLQNSTTYNFYVTAKNTNDVEGDATSIFTATPVSSGGGGGGGGDPLEISTEPTVTTTSNSATIHWTTNKEASSKVYYGPTQDIKGVSPEANTTPRVQNHETQITGLLSCVTYWFKSESFDADGNSVQSLGGEFKTAGCKGDSTIVVSDIKTVTAIAGATASAKVSGKGITAVAPAGIKDGLDIAIEALKLEQDKVAGAINSPTGKNWVGDNAYSLKALQDEVTEVDGGFDQSVSVSIDYTDADLNGFDSSTLKIYHYEDATGWMPLTNCSNEYDALTGTGTVTCDTTSFSVFGLFADSETTTSGSSATGHAAPSTTPVVQPASPVLPTSGGFTKDLALTMTDVEVKMLQVFLNAQGFILADSGFGSKGNETQYFGPRTFTALVKFQERYKAEILDPLGLKHGTGFFGEKTRAFVNSLLSR